MCVRYHPTMTYIVLLALSVLYPRQSLNLSNGEIIGNVNFVVEAAQEFDVPVALVLSICWQESRIGLDPRAASMCGVRWRGRWVSSARESARMASRSLFNAHRNCGSWDLAVRNRIGDGCNSQDPINYVGEVMDRFRRLEEEIERADNDSIE